MNIADMHVWFRQYAQQMGMQNVRAILPEQIDLLINTSISDIINQLIKENISITNDRVVTDNSKLDQINALRTLYRVKTIKVNGVMYNGAYYGAFVFNANHRNIGKLTYLSGEHTSVLPEINGNDIPKFLYLVDFSLSYRISTDGVQAAAGRIIDHLPSFDADSLETNIFPVRIIDDSYLADTLNDFVLKNRLRSPIMVMYNNGTYDLYIDKFTKRTVNGNDYYVLANNLVPYELRISYIAKPAEVKYQSDTGGIDVDCDLPESMHVDILKHAVDLYRLSISGALQASQNQEKAQQTENARNNYRNENY